MELYRKVGGLERANLGELVIYRGFVSPISVQFLLGRMNKPSKIRWVDLSTVTSYPASINALQVVGVTANHKL